VLRYLQALTDDDERAEDVLQETFIAAWRSAALFRGGASARGWLLTIARHALRRQFRRHAGEPRQLEPLESLAVEDDYQSRRRAPSPPGGEI
jgi:RNA polymerase sigma factor (sigma-70 family)